MAVSEAIVSAAAEVVVRFHLSVVGVEEVAAAIEVFLDTSFFELARTHLFDRLLLWRGRRQ
jgi:hypothetical protein